MNIEIIHIYEGENKCKLCQGWKRIDNGDEGISWKFWDELPSPSNIAVQMGIIKPIECPHCHGTGIEPNQPS